MRPPAVAIASTSPLRVGAPSGCQLDPSHLAIFAPAGSPPAAVKAPLAYSESGAATYRSVTLPSSDGLPLVPPSPSGRQTLSTARAGATSTCPARTTTRQVARTGRHYGR